MKKILSLDSFHDPIASVPSAWRGHAPFAFHLVATLKPKILVELGTHHGFSYFCFCQAIQSHGLQTAAYAVDTWEGDEHAGFYSDEVFQSVKKINDENYASFSQLLRMKFDAAAERFSNGQIDLIHIDGRHFYEDVKEDFNLWLPKLADGAIVLFHDTNERERKNFGVWRFFDELKVSYPSFSFLHSHGLGVICVGTIPETVKAWFDATPSELGFIRQAYSSLGERLKLKWDNEGLSRENNELKEGLSRENEGLSRENEGLSMENNELKLQQKSSLQFSESRIQSLESTIERQYKNTSIIVSEKENLEASILEEQERQSVLTAQNEKLGQDCKHLLSRAESAETRLFEHAWRARRRGIQVKAMFHHPLSGHRRREYRTKKKNKLKIELGLSVAESLSTTSPLLDYSTRRWRYEALLRHPFKSEKRKAYRTNKREAQFIAALKHKLPVRQTKSIRDLKIFINKHRFYQKWDASLEQDFLAAMQFHYCRLAEKIDSIQASIILPTYNRADSIAEAIESVLQQKHQNWELIIVDDGSTDDTEKVVQPFLMDERITYIRQHNSGVSEARNVGLKHACGDFAFYLDSDNKWRENHIQTLLVFTHLFSLDSAYSGIEAVDNFGETKGFRGTEFLWEECLNLNYVDLNSFCHKIGGDENFRFDSSLKRLVDWDFILKYTKGHSTAYAPLLSVYYYDGDDGVRITRSQYSTEKELNDAFAYIRRPHIEAGVKNDEIRKLHPRSDELWRPIEKKLRKETSDVKIGYVVWDWPALSQTFVLNEVRELVRRGVDIKLYFHVAPDREAVVDFEVEQFKVESREELLELIKLHERNALHSPFAYPVTTLFTWPIAEELNIPFSFMAAGVDVTHFENRNRNRISEVTQSPYCVGVITLGTSHRDFLVSSGVPSSKTVMERQSAQLPDYYSRNHEYGAGPLRVCAIGRLVEKKGFVHLIDAAALLTNCEISIFGYGPEEAALKERIKELALSNVTIQDGPTTKEDLHSIYYSADVLVVPSVEAQNGDLDGLPTVLLEAMAAGTPVLASRLSNIPDIVVDGVTGYLFEPGQPSSIVDAVDKLLAAPTSKRNRLAEAAEEKVRHYASAERTADTILGLITSRQLNIFLVTYDNEEFRNINDTIEIIDRIYRYTSLNFKLTIVDNNSDEYFKRTIKYRFCHFDNFEFVELDENVFCGPASNIAINQSDSEYTVYICSKEGFILKGGWDIDLVRAMDENPDAAMAGHLLPLKGMPSLAEIRNYPSFSSWRNQDFASKQPDLPMAHIQGGFYILRTEILKRLGGFNPLVPHSGMDVELSFYLLSEGYELLNIPGIASISNKTRPKAFSLIDEETFAVHPTAVGEVLSFDRIASRKSRQCACCGWNGEDFNRNEFGVEICPNCSSLPFGRSVWRDLSNSGLLQDKPDVALYSMDSGLAAALKAVGINVTQATSIDRPSWLAECVAAVKGQKFVILDNAVDVSVDEVDALVALAVEGTRVYLRVENSEIEKLIHSASYGKVGCRRIKYLSGSGGFEWATILSLFPASNNSVSGA